jgi:hypothetical protein
MTDDDDIQREERDIYWIITLASLPVVVGFLIERHEIDGGGTLSLILVVLGVIGLLTGLRVFGARRRLPRAIVHSREIVRRR